MTAGDLGPIDRLAERAETLAGAWAARARGSTTVGRERALLRLLGVTGLDAAGRPLAWAAVDRYLAGGRDRLGGGVVLPFAMALVEYDLDPQRLALDVASGAVDLALEGELLREADRRALAEEEAVRLMAAATDRIDANRTARRELTDVLGDPARPWIGTTIDDTEIDGALVEVRAAVAAGADLLRVDVPIGRELSDRLRAAGLEVPAWLPRSEEPAAERDPVPTGSQRAFSALRHELDEVAAERRGYVRVGSTPPALGAPEAAVVAAFERIDLVDSDPLSEIVGGRVAPDRAFADHAFAHAMLARAGVIVTLGPGPLVVAPDLTRGIPSDAATRSGRALALQLLASAIARGNGIPADQIAIGALPAWLIDEPDPASRSAAEVALRGALMPGLGLVFEEPADDPERQERWGAIVAAVAPPGAATTAIVRRSAASRPGTLAASRVASTVAAELATASIERRLAGIALEHARATAVAALATLDRLADEGWRSVIGEAATSGPGVSFGADAVAERSEAFDPLGVGQAALR